MTGERFIHAARRIMDMTAVGDYDGFSKMLYEFAEHVLSEVGYADRIDEVGDYEAPPPPTLPHYISFAIVGETGPEMIHITPSAFADALKWKSNMDNVHEWKATIHGTWE